MHVQFGQSVKVQYCTVLYSAVEAGLYCTEISVPRDLKWGLNKKESRPHLCVLLLCGRLCRLTRLDLTSGRSQQSPEKHICNLERWLHHSSPNLVTRGRLPKVSHTVLLLR